MGLSEERGRSAARGGVGSGARVTADFLSELHQRKIYVREHGTCRTESRLRADADDRQTTDTKNL